VVDPVATMSHVHGMPNAITVENRAILQVCAVRLPWHNVTMENKATNKEVTEISHITDTLDCHHYMLSRSRWVKFSVRKQNDNTSKTADYSKF